MKQANNIGRQVAKLRMLSGLSQDETVAQIQCLGKEGYKMTLQLLKNIETGRTGVLHRQIRALCTVFRCSYEDIFVGPKVNASEMNAFLKEPHSRDNSGH